MVHLARIGFQDVAYCLLPPACLPPLDAVISEFLTTAPAHIDKHIWPERKVIMCATFVGYVRSIGVFGYWPLSKSGLFLWKKALKHSKEYFVSGCLKQDKEQGNLVFHTLGLENASPLTSTRGLLQAPDPHFQAFWLSSIPISDSTKKNIYNHHGGDDYSS